MNEKIYLMEMQHRTDEHETDRMKAYLQRQELKISPTVQ